MKSTARVLTASLILLGLSQLPARSAPAAPTLLDAPMLDGPQEDCEEFVPATAGISGVSDDGQTIKLEVMLLLDDVPRARARQVMERVAETYAPLDIEVVIAGYRSVSVPADPPRPGGERPAAEMTVLFKTMKEAMDGHRPKGSDVVHLLTSKDVYFVEAGEPSYGLAGVADCIGGVRYDDRAFSFSEGIGEYDELRDDMAGIIAAHEIGHIMGAHHHYGNCLQGSPLFQENETPCTVMFPFVIVWNAGNFGTLEGAVVRGHAVDFAAP